MASAQAAGSGLAPGKYQLVELGVLIKDKNASGKAWDRPSSPPDPSLKLRLGDKTVAECKAQDTFEFRCEVEAEIQIDADSVLTLEVVDSDIASDDSVGKARLAGLTSHGQVNSKLVMEVEGQLAAAHVRLLTRPGLFGEYKDRLLGLLVGVAAGLLLLLGLKDFWFRQRTPKDSSPTEDMA
jgi:hypothetical protein